MEAVRIRTNQAEAGLMVAADVYTGKNQLVITKGAVLDDRLISRLNYYEIYELMVYCEEEEQKNEDSYLEMVRSTPEFKRFHRTYMNSVNQVKSNLDQIVNGNKEPDMNSLLMETDRIIREGRNGAHILEMLHGIRNYDDITYVHSLNVSLICNIFANWLKFNQDDTQNLILAGLLHDIGKMLIPKEIISKDGRLTPIEYNIIQQHTVKGYQALKDLPIDIRIKHAALMHHERCDGSGYPNGFLAGQINEYAKIIAIADVYDAMTSSRIYRHAICPFDVIENFERDGFLKFDPGYLMTFMERIVESYIHNMVRLNDGREGEVIMINRLSLSRPVIRVGSEFVDLSKDHTLWINEIV